MNSLWVVLFSFSLFIIGYIFYSRRLERLWGIDPSRETPAESKYDGTDYVPAKHWLVLFGHHFSSIAGAGPILGPVIATMLWGWVPTVLWLVLGSIFFGGVHDFSALVASLRTGGKSIADVCEVTMSRRAKMIFAAFIWLTLVLVISVFAAAAAKTLSTTPEVVIPTFGLVVVAIIVGVLLYKLKLSLPVVTLIGIAMLFGLIVMGYNYPINLGPNSFNIWLIVLFVYAYIASVLPVNILLQPRDYLAAFVLFFGLVAGYIGLFLTHPQIHAPAYISFSSSKGGLWPMMFVIVACGAISGFHSLVSSGTTSKQLASERDARKIGYGAMITESILAVLATLSVAAGLYWSGGPKGLVYPELMKGGNWIKTFGTGYGQIVKPLFGVFGLLIGVTMLKTFIMTTLDTATRIARYVGQELFGEGLGLRLISSKYISTTIIILFAFYLSLGAWQSIWPIFGASNQLVAALALFVASTFLISMGKNSLYTLIPAIIMLVTTVAAIISELSHFIPEGKVLLSAIGVALLVLTTVLLKDIFKVVFGKKNGRS